MLYAAARLVQLDHTQCVSGALTKSSDWCDSQLSAPRTASGYLLRVARHVWGVSGPISPHLADTSVDDLSAGSALRSRSAALPLPITSGERAINLPAPARLAAASCGRADWNMEVEQVGHDPVSQLLHIALEFRSIFVNTDHGFDSVMIWGGEKTVVIITFQHMQHCSSGVSKSILGESLNFVTSFCDIQYIGHVI